MNDAELLIGSELQVPGAGRAGLEPGWNYVSDLIGCTVVDHGREIGRIEDVQFGAGEAPLLIVANGAGEKFDVPFAEAYLEGVDLAQRQVRMNLPEGMLEINAPVTAEEKQELQGFERARLKAAPFQNRISGSTGSLRNEGRHRNDFSGLLSRTAGSRHYPPGLRNGAGENRSPRPAAVHARPAPHRG
jgi:hypothetical protein